MDFGKAKELQPKGTLKEPAATPLKLGWARHPNVCAMMKTPVRHGHGSGDLMVASISEAPARPYTEVVVCPWHICVCRKTRGKPPR